MSGFSGGPSAAPLPPAILTLDDHLDASHRHSQGETFDEARGNLHQAIALMLEEAPGQFGVANSGPPPGALLEKLFVVLPK